MKTAPGEFPCDAVQSLNQALVCKGPQRLFVPICDQASSLVDTINS